MIRTTTAPARRFLRALRTKGAALVEYAILLGLAAAIGLGTILALGGDVANVFTVSDAAINRSLDAANTTQGGTSGGGGAVQPPGPPEPTGFQMLLGSADDKRACVHGTQNGDRATYCWGENWIGAFGNGNATGSNVAVLSQITGALTDLETNANETCAIKGTEMWCWGEMNPDAFLPAVAPYAFGVGVRTLSLSDNVCGALANGALACTQWNNSVTTYLASGVFDVTSSYFNDGVCALMADRTVRCKGDPMYGGNWGNTFVARAGLADVEQLLGSRNAMCALLDAGVSCWGYAMNGLLGTGETSNRSTPALIPGTGSIGALYSNSKVNAMCGSTPGGGALCWGSLPFGTDGAMMQVSTPTAPPGWPGGMPVVGDGFLCAGLTTGGVRCMGQGPQGELGDGTNTPQTAQWRDVIFPAPATN